jgi:hypothetical protein
LKPCRNLRCDHSRSKIDRTNAVWQRGRGVTDISVVVETECAVSVEAPASVKSKKPKSQWI